MSNINLVIGREFNERVRKKSFIISTILVPLLMALMAMAPSLILYFGKSELKEIEVIDLSGVIFENLQSNDEVHYHLTELSLDEARAQKQHFGVLYIGEDILTNNSNVRLYTNSASSLMLESSITESIRDVIERDRLKAYNIENLDDILRSVEAKVSLQTIRNDVAKPSETSSSSVAAMGVGYILGFILYLFLMIYGAMVMTSVIEEKSSRVLEVLVSSVKPFELLMGKIISIALVAVTQIAIWAVLMLALLIFVLPLMLPSDIQQSIEVMQAGGALSPEMMGGDAEMISALVTLTDVGYITEILLYAFLFLIGGYLLYSSMFAAVGSAVDTTEDAQNLQMPIMLPIILSFFIQLMVSKDPNSTIVQIFSMVPLTSPIIMMARIPHGIPLWEIITSLVLLYGSFVGMVWIASKIYRVGIFMHGKRPTLKELWRWTRYDY